MKLLTKTSLYFVSIALFVFIVGGIVIVVSINAVIDDEIERALRKREEIITTQLINGVAPAHLINFEQRIQEVPASEGPGRQARFVDTLMYDVLEDQFEPYKYLQVERSINKRRYRIEVYHSLIESDDLIESVFQAMLAIFLSLLIASVVFNFVISRHLWRPFYSTLRQLGRLRIDEQAPLRFDATSTSEFRELNNIAAAMIERLRRDYVRAKDFAANASHEIQTPLAIIRTQTELLIQSDSLKEEQAQALQSIYSSAGRLARLNQSLLLLARIDNKQFSAIETVDVSALLRRHLSETDELITLKGIELHIDVDDNVHLEINPYLADSLLANLLRNAIRHNVRGGEIRIELRDGHLRIANTGPPPTVATELVFERFVSSADSADSHGLGLSIVKSICDQFGCWIGYEYTQDHHVLSLRW